ncbi:MAG TPA: type 4a pilus biogenesis protein PilO [Acidobacteriota bacterium]|nr:type 4a pilus biogenesis protein PilO [Acidobacteriota bacterium]
MSLALPRSAWWGHGLVVAGFLLSLGVTRVAWFEPIERERRVLEGERARLRAEVTDLRSGIADLDRWARSHPGEDGLRGRAKRALPAGTMVAALLESLGRLAAAHDIRTTRIQPAGAPAEEVVADASGAAATYQKIELRFRLEGRYRNLGAYLEGVEALDQLVVVRSVSLRRDGAAGPGLAADVALWVYGAP